MYKVIEYKRPCCVTVFVTSSWHEAKEYVKSNKDKDYVVYHELDNGALAYCALGGIYG